MTNSTNTNARKFKLAVAVGTAGLLLATALRAVPGSDGTSVLCSPPGREPFAERQTGAVNTAGVWWRRLHGVGVASFAVLLVIASVLGYRERTRSVRERTRSDSILEFSVGGHGLPFLKPGQIGAIGGLVRVKDPVTIESVTPISRVGDGRIVDVREGPRGGVCGSGWPMRTLYTRQMAGAELNPDRRDQFVGLYFLPSSPRWVVEGVVFRYARNGIAHEQRFDMPVDMESKPTNPGCPLQAQVYWDAPVDADPDTVVCRHARQLEVQFHEVQGPWPPDVDVRTWPLTFLRTVATWAPDTRDPAIRAAVDPLAAAARQRGTLLKETVTPLLGPVVSACRAAGFYPDKPPTG